MALPEGALTSSTPRLIAFRHSMIPRPKNKLLLEPELDLSPKSVIVDRRFISPASSSSSSMDRRSSNNNNTTLTELPGSHKNGQPRHDRGYSISDGEFSDPDSSCNMDHSTSTATSLELPGKVGNSGPLESLPETHSLALEASTNSNVAPADLETSNTRTSVDGMESSEPTTTSIFVERSCSDSISPHNSSRSNINYQADEGTSVVLPIPRSNSDIHSRGLQMSAVEDHEKYGSIINQPSEWSQTSTSSSSSSGSSASEQDGKEESNSTRNYGLSRRSKDHSRPKFTFSAELSTSGINQVDVDNKRIRPVVAGQGAASSFGYPGTPLVRFSPSWSQAAGTPPNNTLASPRVEKGFGSYSPASSQDLPMGLRYQHRFLSGPIMGSMIPKPPPSKWDDAEKWIVSPGHSDQSPAQPHHRANLPTLSTGRRNSIAGATQSVRSSFGTADSPDYSTPPGENPMSPQFENAFINAGKLLEVAPITSHTNIIASNSLKKRSKALSFGDLSRRFDPNSRAATGIKPQPAQQQSQDHHTVHQFRQDEDNKAQIPSNSKDTQITKAILSSRGEKQQSPDDTYSQESRIPKHARSVSMKEISSTVVVPVAAPVISFPNCRDMGTQMTPAESLRNSTCTTPGLTCTSPTRHNTPARSGRRASSLGTFHHVETLELQSCHLAKLELRKLAGDGLDRNSSVWTTREEEEMESAASLRGDNSGDLMGRCKNVVQANAWEEAEQAKALVRYKNKEAKIKAWEELQKVQAEAEMKKIEAKAEKILVDANEKMRDRMAMAAKKAAEMRAAAEAVRSEQAAKAAEKAELIRKTGLLSPARSSFTSCFLVI